MSDSLVNLLLYLKLISINLVAYPHKFHCSQIFAIGAIFIFTLINLAF